MAENNSLANGLQLKLRSTHSGPLKKATSDSFVLSRLSFCVTNCKSWRLIVLGVYSASTNYIIHYITAPCITGNGR